MADLPNGDRVEFKYDPFARRLAKRVIRDGRTAEAHHFVWDRVTTLHDVGLDDAGAASDVTSYLFEEPYRDIPLAQRRGTDWVYLVNDPIGTPEEIVDGSGSVVGRLGRSSYGRTVIDSGSKTSTPFRFRGQWEDPELGLHYNRYRYYDPDAGRYISPDPIGIDGGLNLYAYTRNPIGWIDPMGWQHGVGVDPTTSGAPGFLAWAQTNPNFMSPPGSGNYQSGWGAGNPCPGTLQSQALSHTEGKFATDLINYNNSLGPGQQNLTGQQFTLTGKLPPCPNCHSAMRRAAAQTGANIRYQWEQPAGSGRMQTMDYSGTANPHYTPNPDPNNPGALAQLNYPNNPAQGGWAMGPNGPVRAPGGNTWGYANNQAAYQSYYAARAQC